ncbi:pre-rRNA-processing protein TSR2 [Annulohypoxylon maeteangense]|uniref:pre-rRNA-processing protein TSR2 n=1 Tax=Annulohypoxylon maeteangense TaxID=1927788 RepID=UPI002007F094|nr:pre-rRNA-processing protein TSR2 [Annulohypoxylon maeteangense]KAI0887828.1 pre-rRNA-processing protein TSR2 [Annulohypoxylon maeteangense]
MASTEAESSPETRQAQFEQGVAISLHLWVSLTVAVQNSLGGPDSDDKRDWFAGAIVDMFPSFVNLAKPRKPSQKVPQDPIAEDVEATLLQVMWDEFETNVDDDSEVEVADRIVKIRTQCATGSFEFVEELRRRWLATKGKTIKMQEVDGGDQETDWESDDDDDDEEDEDVEMDEAPALVAAPKERPPPEVDEDGFTKVTRKKR